MQNRTKNGKLQNSERDCCRFRPSGVAHPVWHSGDQTGRNNLLRDTRISLRMCRSSTGKTTIAIEGQFNKSLCVAVHSRINTFILGILYVRFVHHHRYIGRLHLLLHLQPPLAGDSGNGRTKQGYEQVA